MGTQKAPVVRSMTAHRPLTPDEQALLEFLRTQPRPRYSRDCPVRDPKAFEHLKRRGLIMCENETKRWSILK